MTDPHPSRLAMALLDRLVGDEPLKGDLVEEFQRRRSQWWLWRQVLGAVACKPMLRPRRRRQSTEMLVLGAAVLVLVSFEAVFVANVLHRLVLGPPLPNITGYAYLFQYGVPELPAAAIPGLAWWLLPVAAFVASLPAAWIVARLHQHHYTLSLGFVTASVMLCAVLNLRSPFLIQFLTMFVFVVGLLLDGRIAPPSHARTRILA